jgi:hypothetical protein
VPRLHEQLHQEPATGTEQRGQLRDRFAIQLGGARLVRRSHPRQLGCEVGEHDVRRFAEQFADLCGDRRLAHVADEQVDVRCR